jgi:hypothetical protein
MGEGGIPKVLARVTRFLLGFSVIGAFNIMVESTSASSHLWPTMDLHLSLARQAPLASLQAVSKKSHPDFLRKPPQFLGTSFEYRRVLACSAGASVRRPNERLCILSIKAGLEPAGYEQALANPRAAVAPWITTRRTLSAEASPLGAQHRTKTGPSRA